MRSAANSSKFSSLSINLLVFLSFWGMIPALGADLAAQGSPRSSVSQFGITWNFDKTYPTGNFANGDWWVVGPVKVTSISRPAGRSGRDGSMVNPMPINEHGYDDRNWAYDSKLNVANSLPLTLNAGDSLVSMISDPTGFPASDVKTWIKSGAVLSVMASAPAAGSFRPPLFGTQKPVYNTANLRRNLLPNLAPSANLPSMAAMERLYQRAWIDARDPETKPWENMHHYGREQAKHVSEAALMLCMDTNVVGNKETLLIGFVQSGIDIYGIITSGGGFPADGGHGQARKYPLLFAGYMLNEQAIMQSIHGPEFGEDDQTFYVRETSPGVFNNGNGGYTAQHKDMAEWAIRHRHWPQLDDSNWTANYRQCCTALSWQGYVLAARIMGMKSLWQHDALFDYTDRYIQVQRSRTQDDAWFLTNSAFSLAMWDKYRSSYGDNVPETPLALNATVRETYQFDSPTGLPSTPLRDVSLTWNNAVGNTVKEFRVYRGTTAQNLALLADHVQTESFNDLQLSTSRTYYYAVSYIYTDGSESVRSPVVSANT